MAVAYALRSSQTRVLADSVWCGASASCSTGGHCTLRLTGGGLRHRGGWLALRSQRDHVCQALYGVVERVNNALIPNKGVSHYAAPGVA